MRVGVPRAERSRHRQREVDAAATASWLTRSTPGSCSLVNQRSASNAATAAAAGLGSSGKTGCTADSPRISASNTASALSPCGAIKPMPVTTTIGCAAPLAIRVQGTELHRAG